MNLILPLHMSRSPLLRIVLSRCHRAPPTLTLNSRLLKRIAMRARLRKQDVNLLKSATRGLRAVVPHVSGSKETADQRPDENLGTDGGDTGTAAEDHDPGGEPLAGGAEAAGDVAVAEGSDFWAWRGISMDLWIEVQGEGLP